MQEQPLRAAVPLTHSREYAAQQRAACPTQCQPPTAGKSAGLVGEVEGEGQGGLAAKGREKRVRAVFVIHATREGTIGEGVEQSSEGSQTQNRKDNNPRQPRNKTLHTASKTLALLRSKPTLIQRRHPSQGLAANPRQNPPPKPVKAPSHLTTLKHLPAIINQQETDP